MDISQGVLGTVWYRSFLPFCLPRRCNRLCHPYPLQAVLSTKDMRTEVPNSDPALFLFLASLASLRPWDSFSKTVFLAFTVSTADTSEVMCDLTGEGSEGLQDCRKSIFSPVNDASGLLESGRTGEGVEGTV